MDLDLRFRCWLRFAVLLAMPLGAKSCSQCLYRAASRRPVPLRDATGILLIVGTVLGFACMDGTAKWLGRRINPWEVIAVW